MGSMLPYIAAPWIVLWVIPVPWNWKFLATIPDHPRPPPVRSANFDAASAGGPAGLGLRDGRRPNQPAAKIPAVTGLVLLGKILTGKTMGFLPSNWSGFPVKIFPSSNSMMRLSTRISGIDRNFRPDDETLILFCFTMTGCPINFEP